jgi:hypothetical protein
MATRQVAVGEKHACPLCGSRDIGAMSPKETFVFYGGNAIVVCAPRRCRACRHGWEVRTGRFASIAMLAFSAMGILVGLGFMIGCVAMMVLIARAPNNAILSVWNVFALGTWCIAGFVLTMVSARALSKYWRAGSNMEEVVKTR